MQYPKTFAIFTAALVLIAGAFICFLRADQAADLSYIPDADWSKPRVVTPSLNTSYSREFVVNEAGQGFSFWGGLSSAGDQPELRFQILDSKGRVRQKPRTLIQGVGSWEFAVAVQKEMIHLFWLAQGAGDRLDLHHSRYDLEGKLLGDSTLITDLFVKPQDLQAAGAPDGKFMLAWMDQESHRVRDYQNLQVLCLGADGQILLEPHEIADREHNNYLPNLIADAAGRFHLTWIQEVKVDPGIFVKRNIYYQSFTSEGTAFGEPRWIDEATADRVGMAVNGDTVYLAWNKVVAKAKKEQKQLVDTFFENTAVFGGKLNVLQPEEPVQAKMLTSASGPFFDQNLAVDAAGQVHLVFVAQYHDYMALTHAVYDEDLANIKKPKRIYPEQRLDNLGVTASIFPDPVKGIHLFWEDGSSSGKLYYYYANTVRDGRISPIQVVGLNTNNFVVSSVVSLGYIFIMPFVNLIFNLIFFAIFFVGLCWRGIGEIFHRLKIDWVMENPYLGPVITIIGFMVFYSRIGMWSSLFTPYHPNLPETVFVLITALAACGLYLWLNKTQRGTLSVCIATATLWAFWVSMMIQIFALPGVNYYLTI